jgi:hypothetical protein
LVTFENPKGGISNSDMELAESATQHDVLVQQFDIPEATTHTSSDNAATVWWKHNGATSASGPTARLLPSQALHQRHHHYSPLFNNIAGEANTMAVVFSHLWLL